MTYENDKFQILKSMKVPDDFKSNGFVYVLSNECMPGIYKIGMTKHSPEVRAKEISASTGVPKPFKVIAAFHSNNPASDEKLIHKAFAKERISDNREFFKLEDNDLSESLNEIRALVGPERNGETAEYAIYDSFISFRHENELDLNEELIEQGLGSVVGHLPAVKNFLIRAGIDYAKQLISKYNSSIVINTDGSVVMVKSLEAQCFDAEVGNEPG
ncbi:GIY-YIG nuclease family protein [Escherichia coli]|nr:GIY-YIG nuclease family protein [Escherichia coli]